MKSVTIPLNQLNIGESGKVSAILCDGSKFRHFLNLGIIKDTIIKPYEKNASGDLTAYSIRGAIIAIRGDEAHSIMVSPVS